jgi:subtilisin family serine protease
VLHAKLKPGWFAPGFYHTDFATMDAHGTEVAGLIAARRAEGEDGIWGMAPGCTVVAASMGMPIHRLLQLQSQFFAQNAKSGMADLQKEMAARKDELQAFNDTWMDYVAQTLSESIRYLADRGIRMINHSGFLDLSLFKTYPASRARLEAAFAYPKQKDVLVVLGSGNMNTRVTDYPGDDSFVLIVGGSALVDQRCTMTTRVMGMEIKQGSCFGPRLNLVAPIENIVVAALHEPAYYDWKDTPIGPQKAQFERAYEVLQWGGTSSAAPQAAALAALVRTIRPDLKASEVIRLIEQGVDDIGAPGFDEETGYGSLNFLRTLQLAREARGESL